jgi:hypothetical protein
MNSWPINDMSKAKLEIVYGNMEYEWYHKLDQADSAYGFGLGTLRLQLEPTLFIIIVVVIFHL